MNSIVKGSALHGSRLRSIHPVVQLHETLIEAIVSEALCSSKHETLIIFPHWKRTGLRVLEVFLSITFKSIFRYSLKELVLKVISLITEDNLG